MKRMCKDIEILKENTKKGMEASIKVAGEKSAQGVADERLLKLP